MPLKRTLLLLILLFPLATLAQVKRDSSLRYIPDSAKKLKEVEVKSNFLKAIKDAPGNLSVVDMKPHYNSNTTAVQVLRGTSGIKVKQEGGYGSRTDFFINGSTGKQLKFFLDGLPLDNIGESIGINNVPIEQIDRIEIYKGIIPVDLGADVLGGAINIVSRKDKINYLDISYAIGSFNTNRFNFTGRRYWSKKFYTNLQAYAGYSKNNYGIDADNILPNGKIETIRVKRFHDRYENFIVKAEAGIVEQSWADELSLTVSASGFYKQLQNNVTMTQPYAYAAYREHLIGGLLKYQKNNLLSHLNIAATLSYNRLTGLFIDTARHITLWDGTIVKNDDGSDYVRTKGAEIGRTSYLNTFTNTLNQKFTTAYWLSSKSKIVFSNTLQHYNRSAKDTLAQRINYGLDLYATPSSQFKNVAGLGYDGEFLTEKLKLSTSVKYFYAHQTGGYINLDRSFIGYSETRKPGYNMALAYNVNPSIILKASYEHAIRLPDVEEAFGDLLLINPNPDLKAEESNNINLNILYHQKKFNAELTGFYRDVDHLIFLLPNSQGSAKSYNLLKARIKGVEANFSYRLIPALQFNINGTYQDLRSLSYIEGLGIPNDRYVGQRLPNIPYLLANAGLNYRLEKLPKDMRLQFWYGLNYTHSYYLYWANDGYQPDKITIPMQLLQNAGATLTIKRLSFSLESYNLANSKPFDNFKAQLPGRSISFKTRFYLSKHTSN
ncbi:TonB-dependent receptor [Mucilaginibacter sp. UYCu711]|uniref:TonB-dependent receptor n=1 Tax=Mucilaginibacter sp. UYCu711 TaxID=3156339 RepID=UPI003D19DD31